MEKIIYTLSKLANAYRPIPFWSWNDDLEPERLKEQIRWMHEKGIGGFFMHAREGLETPYLSDHWMHCIAECCEEAETLGMHAWVYDENGFPSGFVGGKLLEKEENRDRFLTYQIGAFDPKADLVYDLSGECLLLTADENSLECLNVYIGTSASTVDILNPAVVDQFLEATHARYESYFGEVFSEKIKGFFTDEPQYFRYNTPYTPLVRRYFREKYDRELFDDLGLLFVEKEGYRQFRYRYWLAMQTLMLQNFAQKVYSWCDNRGVKLTGHYVDEITMGYQIMCCAGVMPFYEFEHIPGIDWLGVTTDNELAPRQLSSAAHQLGKKQILTESFGCCGWDITPDALRRLAGFQYACGVNLLCHHLVPYSERGQRKRDYPAHFHSINPWIDAHFKEFNDYFSRLGYLLAEGEEPVNVAVLHPIRSCYFDYKRGLYPHFDVGELDDHLQKACRMLSARGVNYHFLDETLLERHGFVDGGRIGCGKCAYDYLVLPPMLTMGRHTMNLLKQYADNGGKVLMLGEKPTFLEGEPYGYPWLQTNCTLEEILHAQPYRMEDPNTELYCAYRLVEGKPFLFVQNGSGEKAYTQTFRFAPEIKSFTVLDPVSLKTSRCPLTVTLPANGSLLLFPSAELPPAQKELPIVAVDMAGSQLSFGTNFLTMDAVRYSKDGVHFSEPILRSRLFAQLLEERYGGDLWLRYEFTIAQLPEKLTILAEKKNLKKTCLNGQNICLDTRYDKEPSLWMADITPYIRVGVNTYETQIAWHQSEKTYHTLFGENVTVSLKTCIVYESEIESVYLAGKFGVYSQAPFEEADSHYLIGHSFYIGAAPTTATEPTAEGLAFFRGNLTMQKTVTLENPNVILKIPGRYVTAKVKINGQEAGELVFSRQLDVSQYAKSGDNEIEIVYTVGNRNFLGPFHYVEEDIYIGPDTFDAYALPDADGQITYKLEKFFPEMLQS